MAALFPRCRWIKDATMPDGRWFMPECAGGAIQGEHMCYCPSPPKRLSKEMKQCLAAASSLRMDADQLSEFVEQLKRRNVENVMQ